MTEAYSLIKISDISYPEKLKSFSNMPPELYYKGRLPDPDKKAVAIVGARSCSAYGRMTAEYFAGELAKYGVQIISGLALGIDSYAHRACIDNGGKTFAVLGCGINSVYPRSNTRLSRRILDTGGGLISEFDPDAPPVAYHFPIRNRIISALADALIIVEAKRKSGSLITASYALEQGIPIYAVPGKVCDSLSYGTNELIYQGAAPAISPLHILYDLGIQIPKENTPSSKAKTENYSDEEKSLLEFLSTDPISVDELCTRSHSTPSYISQLLLLLELKGGIFQPAPGLYSRTYR